MPADIGNVPVGIDRLWQVVIALVSGLVTGFGGAIAHLHVRINSLQTRIEAARESDEARRSNANRDLWQELRKMSQSDAEYRERVLLLLGKLPTRDEVHQMIEGRAKRSNSHAG